MSENYVRFLGNGLELEGVLHLPQDDGLFPAVVVCHPHPLYGGDMSNSVVLAMARALAEVSIIAFRFNFRGVGKSEGSFSDGVGEQEDIKAALSFLPSAEKVAHGRIGLAGYSFGANVALPVALQNETIQAVAFVSPFLPASDWGQLKSYLKPKLLLCGSEDHFVPSGEFQIFATELPEPKQYEIIPGADHFWRGYEEKIAERVATFFSATLI